MCPRGQSSRSTLPPTPTTHLPQAAWAHMRFTHLEIDLYRPTHVFPLLAFSRM